MHPAARCVSCLAAGPEYAINILRDLLYRVVAPEQLTNVALAQPLNGKFYPCCPHTAHAAPSGQTTVRPRRFA